MTQPIASDLRTSSNWPANSVVQDQQPPKTETIIQEPISSSTAAAPNTAPMGSGVQSETIDGQQMHDLFQELLALSSESSAAIDEATVISTRNALQTGSYTVDLDLLAQQLFRATEI